MFSIKIFKVALLLMSYVQIILPLKEEYDRKTRFFHNFFVNAVEILAIAVRVEKNKRGIEINGTETKLLQFSADYRTAVLSDLIR